jgi:hypothetical protein
MPVSRILADDLSQPCLNVVGNVGIGSLVDNHSCSGVLHEYVADAFHHPRSLNYHCHPISDVEQLHATRGADLDRDPTHVIRVVRDRGSRARLDL